MAYRDIEKHLLLCEADAPFFLPFLFGERCPGWNDDRGGGFEALNPRHNRYDLYYAVLEGVLFNLYQCYLELIKINGQPKTIKLSGGIVHSSFWLQMCADLFRRKMDVSDMAHGSMLGAAVLALEAEGVIKDMTDFHFATDKIIAPNKEKSKIYAQRFDEYIKHYHRCV